MQKSSRGKLLQLTSNYVGTPFEDNASGDGAGSGIDERPMGNWATLDCVTYVEAVLAPYFGGKLDLENALKALRYKRSPSTFLHRNHFVRHDWIPNAISRGFISDITAVHFGKDKVKRRIWSHNPASWFGRIEPNRVHSTSNAARLLDDLRRKSRKLRRQRSVYKVVPLSTLLPPKKQPAAARPESGWSRLTELPSATLLVFFGRKGEHMAWLINQSGELTIRHASRARRNVRDDSLATFLKMHVALGYLTSLAVFEVAERRDSSAGS